MHTACTFMYRKGLQSFSATAPTQMNKKMRVALLVLLMLPLAASVEEDDIGEPWINIQQPRETGND